jgi:hypothetical protein
MKSEKQILELLSPIYRDLGGNPSELVAVKPFYGGWLNALRFMVVRADDATTWVSLSDLVNGNRRRLENALTAFDHAIGFQDPSGQDRERLERRT